jgi:hypothetical protein
MPARRAALRSESIDPAAPARELALSLSKGPAGSPEPADPAARARVKKR